VDRKELVYEINILLKNKNLDIPEFRRVVSITGQNVQWLLKNIRVRNVHINKRIIDILNLLS
jgi:hypothetical protein